jgi:hypothetical protein
VGLNPAYAMVPRSGANDYPFETVTGGGGTSEAFLSPDGTYMVNGGTFGFAVVYVPTFTVAATSTTVTVCPVITVNDDGSFYTGGNNNGDAPTSIALVQPDGSYTILSPDTFYGGIWHIGDMLYGRTATHLVQAAYSLPDTGGEVSGLDPGFFATWYAEDLIGLAWAGGPPLSSGNFTSAVGFYRMDGAGDPAFSVSTASAGEAYFFINSEGNAVVWQDDKLYIVNLTTQTIDLGPVSAPVTASAVGQNSPFRAVRPGDGWIWIGFSRFSALDLTVLESVDPSSWTTGGTSNVFYDRYNDALWGKSTTDSGITVRLLHRGGVDANPAHIIYEALTNAEWGMGSSSDLIDVAGFEAVGQTLFYEPLGLSVLWTKQQTLQDFIQEILDHIQAVLFVDPQTGLLTLKLIRGDYDVDTLPTISPSTANLTSFSRKLWGDIVNEIRSPGRTPTTSRTRRSPSTTSPASRRRARSFRTAAITTACAMPTSPSGSRRATCARPALRWRRSKPRSTARSGICGRHRCCSSTGPNTASPASSSRHQHRLRQARRSDDQAQPDRGRLRPRHGRLRHAPNERVGRHFGAQPTAMTEQEALTLPFYFAANGIVSITDATYPEVLAGVLGASSNVDAYGFELWGEVALTDGTTEWQSLATMNIEARAELAADIAAEASSTGVAFDSFTGSVSPSVRGFALIGAGTEADNELALITNYSSGTDVYALSRGVLDTVPKAWAAGTPVWFFETDSMIEDPTVRSAGEVVDYKLLTRTSQGLLPLAAAPTLAYTLTERPWLPSRPANITIGGLQFNDIGTAANMIGASVVPVTWSNRNRLFEETTVLSWTASTVAPEDGQTTTITVLKTDLTTVLATHTGLTGSSFDIPVASFGAEALGYVRVSSERIDADGTFESLQAHGLYVQVDMAAPVAPAVEIDTALSLSPAIGSGVAVETDTALALTATVVTGDLQLSGDMTDGDDVLLLSGDMQSGTDKSELSGSY